MWVPHEIPIFFSWKITNSISLLKCDSKSQLFFQDLFCHYKISFFYVLFVILLSFVTIFFYFKKWDKVFLPDRTLLYVIFIISHDTIKLFRTSFLVDFITGQIFTSQSKLSISFDQFVLTHENVWIPNVFKSDTIRKIQINLKF